MSSQPSFAPDADFLGRVVAGGAAWGQSDSGAGRRTLVEFVSANPHAPLTVAHGRGGVIGDVLAAAFHACGWEVQRDFYVNDAEGSHPLRAFARAVLSRYRAVCGGEENAEADDTFSGEYINDIAQAIYDRDGDAHTALPAPDATALFARLAAAQMQTEQRETLARFNVFFDNWTSEATLAQDGAIAQTIARLEAGGHTERRGDALWLRTSRGGDTADRPLVRADGTPTYLAGDLAYHHAKFERGFDTLIDVWGADHAGYVARTQAGLAALGYEAGRLQIVVCQPVRLLQDGTTVRGSRRYGNNLVALAELIDTIGADNARFLLVAQSPDTPLDIDVDAARKPGSPYYQVCATITQAKKEAGGSHAAPTTLPDALVAQIAGFPRVVEAVTQGLAPHLLTGYALSLAGAWRDLPASARHATAAAVAVTLENTFVLLGIQHSLPPGAA